MRAYIQTETALPATQALQLVHQGVAYLPSILHATVDQTHIRQSPRRVRHAEHVHDDTYHIVLYAQGDADIGLNGKAYAAQAGTLAVTGPNEGHSFAPVSRGTVRYAEATFRWQSRDAAAVLRLPLHALLALYAGTPLPERTYPAELPAEAAGELQRYFDALLDGLTGGMALGPLFAVQALHAMLGLLVREVYRPPAAEPAPEPLAAAKVYLEAHYAEPLRVADLARRANLSPGQFHRAFRHAFDATPMAYQTDLRLRAARSLLRFTALPCKQIAARVGYDDVAHFSRVFKKRTGETPTAFRARDLE